MSRKDRMPIPLNTMLSSERSDEWLKRGMKQRIITNKHNDVDSLGDLTVLEIMLADDRSLQ